jgi:hypothetical protein
MGIALDEPLTAAFDGFTLHAATRRRARHVTTNNGGIVPWWPVRPMT